MGDRSRSRRNSRRAHPSVTPRPHPAPPTGWGHLPRDTDPGDNHDDNSRPTTTPPTTVPSSTIPYTPVVALTNPGDLYYSLEQAAQQLIGMNVNQPGLNDFIAWYHQQQTAYQTGQTDISPAAPYDAAVAWIDQNYPTQVLANRYLNDANAINCMIKTGRSGPCPASPATISP
jgi:hypothetical protein